MEDMASISPLNHQLQANSRWARDGPTCNLNLTQVQTTVSERTVAGTSKPPSPRAQQNNARSRPNGHQSADNGHSSNTTSAGTYRSRKFACDICRERKARCDRNQPCCGRCIRLGNKCKYSPPEREETGKFDVAHALETLNSRLGRHVLI
jgi:hypothetical protein